MHSAKEVVHGTLPFTSFSTCIVIETILINHVVSLICSITSDSLIDLSLCYIGSTFCRLFTDQTSDQSSINSYSTLLWQDDSPNCGFISYYLTWRSPSLWSPSHRFSCLHSSLHYLDIELSVLFHEFNIIDDFLHVINDWQTIFNTLNQQPSIAFWFQLLKMIGYSR